MRNKFVNIKSLLAAAGAVVGLFFGAFAGVPDASAATAGLSLGPSSGTFVVESTFEVSIYLDTQGNSVNTIDLALRYPPDKLQLVSSGTGRSIIGLWTSQPKYNNQTGVLELTGGVPGGVNVSRGLITTLTFRVKASGSAVVRFERSRVLLNDGVGTEVLTQNQNSIYDLTLPAPAGPVVVSDTHPEQSVWYRNPNVSLRWGVEAGADAFSYMVSDNITDVPDEISEGTQREITYRNLGEGRKYFHIRAMRNGLWGGSTHFAINIDTSAPAQFEIEVIPNKRTTRTRPVVQFGTTDSLSGMSRYELKVVPLGSQSTSVSGGEQVFIEAQSPYIPPELERGPYDIIVRAYDNAGNYQEITERMSIVPALLRYTSANGLEMLGAMVIPWWVVLLILLLIIIALLLLARRVRRWHYLTHHRQLEDPAALQVQSQMAELQKYREKYGKLAVVILLMVSMIFGYTTQSYAQQQRAADAVENNVLDTPIISTLSRNITNQEIFYVGGRTGTANAQVVLYIQNEYTAETQSFTLASDKNGEWFYRHNTFLPAGKYVLWAQSRLDGNMSPPSPQVGITVEETALQFGATRLSYATLYLFLFVAAVVLITLLVLYILYHSSRGRRKHRVMLKEISEAQESLRRGFAVLNRDIKAELEILHKSKASQKLSQEDKDREAILLKDLEEIEQYLSKEIWDIEHAEHVQ
jgi:hypothetical protein